MTLQELSDRSGVSVGYISQIERGHVTPTLGTLASLARALGVGLDYFVAMPKLSETLVRREDRRRFSLDGVTQQYEQLGVNLSNHEMSAFMIYVPDGYSSETVSHEGEEFIHVIEGDLNITLDGESLSLKSGDSLHFSGNRRHSWENRSGKTAQLLWVGRLTLFPMKGGRAHGIPLDAFAPGRSDGMPVDTGQSSNDQKGSTGDQV